MRARGSEAFRHRSGALRKETGLCDEFVTHFLELFCCSMLLLWLSLLRGGLPGSSRLWVSVANGSGGPLLLRIRKMISCTWSEKFPPPFPGLCRTAAGRQSPVLVLL